MPFFIDNFLDLFTYLDSGIGVFVYIFIYILAVLFLLPASWLSLLAGFLYGKYLGTFIVFISAFLGASFSFYIAKKYFAIRIKEIISKFSKFSLLEKIIQKAGLKLIILTRLSPLFPFSILNYFYGFNQIKYKDFALSLFFIIPGSFLYCSLGSLAKNFNELMNYKVNNNSITTIISILSTCLVVYLLSKYANEIIKDSSHL